MGLLPPQNKQSVPEKGDCWYPMKPLSRQSEKHRVVDGHTAETVLSNALRVTARNSATYIGGACHCHEAPVSPVSLGGVVGCNMSDCVFSRHLPDAKGRLAVICTAPVLILSFSKRHPSISGCRAADSSIVSYGEDSTDVFGIPIGCALLHRLGCSKASQKTKASE